MADDSFKEFALDQLSALPELRANHFNISNSVGSMASAQI